jgi:hypothetical protein
MTSAKPANTCTHIFADNHHCGSPALRGERLCYYHHPSRRPIADPYHRRSRRGFDIAIPTDPASLQSALIQVIQRLASNKIDTQRAGLLLYSLQIVSAQLPASPIRPRPPEQK